MTYGVGVVEYAHETITAELIIGFCSRLDSILMNPSSVAAAHAVPSVFGRFSGIG